MVEALILLMFAWGNQYAEMYHGQWHHDTTEKIEKYHIDDAITILHKKKLEIRVEF